MRPTQQLQGSKHSMKLFTRWQHHTVTRIDVIFRYPDRVPLTHFVHGAKKILASGPDFSVEFSAPPVFSGGAMEK